MKNSQRFWTVILLILLSFAILRAQQQQSGGGGGGNMNLAQVGASSVTLGSKTSANSIPVVIASDNGPQAVSQSGTWGVNINASQTVGLAAGSAVVGKFSIDQTTPGTTNLVQVGGTLPALSAGTALIGKVVPATSCGTTAFSQAWATVPTVSTAVTATTTCVQAIMVTNTTASAVTFSVTDGQGSPITVVATYSVPGNSQVTFPFNFAPMTSGVKWIAGGAGLTGSVVGIQ